MRSSFRRSRVPILSRCRPLRPSAPRCSGSPCGIARCHRRCRSRRRARRYGADRAWRELQLEADGTRRPARAGSAHGIPAHGVLTLLRVGQGFDVHRFSGDPGRSLVLGGVVIAGARRTRRTQRCRRRRPRPCRCPARCCRSRRPGRAVSRTRLRSGRAPTRSGCSRGLSRLLETSGLKALNADCTVVCERPRLAPHTAEMGSNLAEVLGAPVSVKAKRAEGLGALGRVEGIACLAVALVSSSDTTTS